MFYHVSKIGWFLMEPANLLLFLLVAAIGLSILGFARTGQRLLIVSVSCLLMLGFSPLTNWLMIPLETRFPVPDLTGKAIDGIILLGGAVEERQTEAHGQLSLNDASERVIIMADLARRFPKARVVLSGGSGFYSGFVKPESLVLQENLGVLGLSADRVILESASVNTFENAVFSKAIAKPQPGETWLLVTSAWHMPRSVGIFRKTGWSVVAYPVDFRTAGWDDATRGFSSSSNGLRRARVATSEWAGLFVYWLTGKTDAFFPAP
jgi:uncharacterized SAM-binding protein YcdF (DUF218 family)